jgi:hypothetical protein
MQNKKRIEEIRAKILWKMYRHRYIGEKHTDIDNLPKGFPEHEHKLVKKAVRKLIKDGFLIVKTTRYGKHVSINPKMIAEVRKVVKDLE